MDYQTKQRLLIEVSDFLYEEAEYLCDRNYQAWLPMLSEDLSYKMFIASNVSSKALPSEYLESELGVAWFDEGKDVIGMRIQQLATGMHWAEEPPSRTSRLITNIRLSEFDADAPGQSVSVRYNFLINRVRNDDEDDYLSGKKIDRIEFRDGRWQLKSRRIYVNQSVILMGNLSFIV